MSRWELSAKDGWRMSCVIIFKTEIFTDDDRMTNIFHPEISIWINLYDLAIWSLLIGSNHSKYPFSQVNERREKNYTHSE